MLAVEDFASRMIPYLQSAGVVGHQLTDSERSTLLAAAPLVQERMTVLSECVGMLSFLFVSSENLLIEDDAREGLPENAGEVLAAAIQVIEGLDDFDAESLQSGLSTKLIEQMELKPKFAFGALRTAISGRRVSPPLFESMVILGREETLKRLTSFARSV